jgi:hypothetical protein
MRIKLINCDSRLKAIGINMEDIGSYDRLGIELAKRMAYLWMEYDFPPLDYMLIDVEEGTEIPDLSEFGEVDSVESANW